MADPIQRMYDERDEAGREAARNYNKPPIRFRASELGDCARRIWYRLSGYVPAPRYGRADDYGVDGDAQHDVVRQMLEFYGAPIRGITFNEDGSQTEDKMLVTEFDVGGLKVDVASRCDGEIFLEDYNEWALLEIKSANFWKYKYLNDAFINGGDEAAVKYVKENRKSYYYQTQMTATMHGNKLVYLVMKDRSDCRIGLHDAENGLSRGLVMPVEPEVVNTILNRVAHIKRAVMDGEAPAPEYIASSSECSYCPYLYLCHAATKRRRHHYKPAVKYPDPTIKLPDSLEEDDGA